MHSKINELLQKHFYETEEYSVSDTAPSALRRGEGTPKDYFILKVDLVNSTRFVMQKRHVTYLRLAHTFLSTIDEITRQYGAESNQVEYAGDGIIAYFPCDKVAAINVLRAAYYCRYAAQQMKGMHQSFGAYQFETKVMLHKDQLLVSKIGPWGGSRVTAIGYGLHYICKMEKDVPAGEGRASTEFGAALERKYMRFLSGVYAEEQASTTAQPSGLQPPCEALNKDITPLGSGTLLTRGSLSNLASALPGGSAVNTSKPASSLLDGFRLQEPRKESLLDSFRMQEPQNEISSLAAKLYRNPPPVSTTPSLSEVKRTLLRYRVAWGPLRMFEEGI